MINLSYCVYLLLAARLKRKRALVNVAQRLRRGTLPGAKPGPVPAPKPVPFRMTSEAQTLFFAQCLFEAVVRAQKKKLRSKKWDDKNKDRNVEYRKKLTPEQQALVTKQKLAWVKNNPDRFKQSQSRVRKKNPIVGLLRNRVFCCIAREYKSAATLELLGCSLDVLKSHLEKQFQPGMAWDTRGGKTGWQIDHIRPCASFDLTDPAQQRECFHYTNLQPLWAKDNLSKGDSYGRE